MKLNEISQACTQSCTEQGLISSRGTTHSGIHKKTFLAIISVISKVSRSNLKHALHCTATAFCSLLPCKTNFHLSPTMTCTLAVRFTIFMQWICSIAMWYLWLQSAGSIEPLPYPPGYRSVSFALVEYKWIHSQYFQNCAVSVAHRILWMSSNWL